MKVIKCIIITTIIAVLANDISNINILLLLIGAFFSFLFIKRYSFHQNYAKYIVLGVYWISMIFMPAFHLVHSSNLSYVIITPEWDKKILDFGIPIYTFAIIVTLLLSRSKRSDNQHLKVYRPKVVPYSILKIGIICCILLSLFCFSMGLGRMGSEAIVLPYHLSGIINLFRNVMVPFLFAIAIEGYIMSSRSIPKSIWVLFIVWSIIEIFAWMSKSILVSHLQPVLMLLYMYYKPSLYKNLRVIIPLAIIFLFMYPIIEGMRSTERRVSLIHSFNTAQQDIDRNRNPYLIPLNRAFMFGAQYAQDYDYINDKQLFDFSKFQALVAIGGSAVYQTFIIDGYPSTAIHSSGTNGILDPLFHGGIGLVYIVIFLIILLAVYADKLIRKNKLSIVVFIVIQLLTYTRSVNISTLYDATGLQTLFVYLVCIYIAYNLNFKTFINESNNSK